MGVLAKIEGRLYSVDLSQQDKEERSKLNDKPGAFMPNRIAKAVRWNKISIYSLLSSSIHHFAVNSAWPE